MKRILITGAAGFIGFHTALQLKKRGDFVIGCDDFNPYYDVRLKTARSDILRQNGIEIEKMDICEDGVIASLLKHHQITHVLHLAGYAGVRHSMHSPQSYTQSNIHGFVVMLEALKNHPHIPMVYASSSSVYGQNTKVPFSESDQTDHPASYYGATKKCNEVIASAYHHLYGIQSTGLRYFTVYGPWGRPDMAYYGFTRAILEEKPISVFGEGKLQRDFTYVDDIVSGNIAAIDLEASYEIFNLGNSVTETVLSLVQHLEELTQKKAIIQLQPMPAGDVPITYADISKAKEKLGFVPKTSLKDGLAQFVEWYLSFHDAKILLSK